MNNWFDLRVNFKVVPVILNLYLKTPWIHFLEFPLTYDWRFGSYVIVWMNTFGALHIQFFLINIFSIHPLFSDIHDLRYFWIQLFCI